jgi:hypothetical protein
VSNRSRKCTVSIHLFVLQCANGSRRWQRSSPTHPSNSHTHTNNFKYCTYKIYLRIQSSNYDCSVVRSPSSSPSNGPPAVAFNGPPQHLPAVLPEMGLQQLFELSSTHDAHLFFSFPFCLSRFAHTSQEGITRLHRVDTLPLCTHMTLSLSRYQLSLR